MKEVLPSYVSIENTKININSKKSYSCIKHVKCHYKKNEICPKHKPTLPQKPEWSMPLSD